MNVKKIKKDFIEIANYDDLKVGDIVKIFSEGSNKFISKHPYFINGVDSKTIYFQNISTSALIEYDKAEGSLKCV